MAESATNSDHPRAARTDKTHGVIFLNVYPSPSDMSEIETHLAIDANNRLTDNATDGLTDTTETIPVHAMGGGALLQRAADITLVGDVAIMLHRTSSSYDRCPPQRQRH